MDYNGNGGINFLKCSLLITKAIPNGLKTLLTDSQHYDFQELCDLLIQGIKSPDIHLQCGLTALQDARESFFNHLSGQVITNKEFDDIKQKLLSGFSELGISLDHIHDICTKFSFSEEDVLMTHELLSKEKRDFCQLGPNCYHATLQRSAECEAVFDQLNELNQKQTNGNSTVFIDGQYGSGKSELARQVAGKLYKANSTSKSRGVMVVNAETKETLLLSYVKFAKELLCNFTQIEMACSTGLMLEEQLRLLKHIIGDKLKMYSNWTVVIDNVNHFESLSDYWPKPSSNDWGSGNIIVTIPSIEDVNKTYLDSSGHVTISHGLHPSQAIQLLSEVSGVTKKNHALKVAHMLEFHPLALSCAAVFVRLTLKHAASPWEAYEDMFGKYKANSSCNGEENGTFIKDYSKLCAKAIRLLLKQLHSQHEEISNVNYILGIFYPFAVKKEMLGYCLEKITDTSIDRFLQDLSPFLLIERNDESNVISLQHQLQDIDKSRPKVKPVAILSYAAAYLAQVLPCLESFHVSVINDFIYNISCDTSMLVSEVKSLSGDQQRELVNHLNDCDTADADAVDMLVQLANQCLLIQRPKDSILLFKIAQSIIEKDGESYSPEHHALVYHRLGISSGLVGSKEAERQLNKASEFFMYCREVPYQKISDVFTALGDTATAAGDFDKAREFYKTSSKIADNNSDIASSWYKLGNIAAIGQSFQLAKDYYEKALELMANSNLLNISKVLTCVGAMSVCIGEYQQARDYLQRAMTLEKRLYSKYHPCRLSSIQNSANAYNALGDSDSAEQLLTEYLTITQNITCRLNTEVSQVCSQLGALHAAKADWKSAIEHYKQALKIQENTTHCLLNPSIADICGDLGEVCAKSGKLELAKSFHERAIGMRGLLFQADHPDIGTSYFHLGKVYNSLDDSKTASSLLERSVEIRRKVFGSQHPKTLESIFHLGNSFVRLGRLKNARTLYESIAKEQEKNTETQSALAKISEQLGEVNVGLGDLMAAKEQFKRAIELQRCQEGPDHPEVARPMVRLALVHENCKEIREAKTLLEKALRIYQKSIHSIGKATIFVTESHLKRVLSKLPQNRCAVM